MTSSAILIPARYGSTRFPGKPLANLDNVPMIRRVYERCRKTGLDTYVLTDDMRIYNRFGSSICWIEEEAYAPYKNGTERCAGAIKGEMFDKYDTFINVQGDMPDIDSAIIDQTLWHLKHYQVTTAFTNMPTEQQNDPNTVKMVRAGDQALWFGRGITGYGDWHLGVYGYKRNALEMYPKLAIPEEENIEQLEQLRWLKNGWNIGCLSVQYNGVEINSPEDVDIWHKQNSQ